MTIISVYGDILDTTVFGYQKRLEGDFNSRKVNNTLCKTTIQEIQINHGF